MSTVGGPEGLMAAVEAQMPLRERGLKPSERMSATEPRVDHGDVVIPFPEGMLTGSFGTAEQFVEYLRHVHAIPEVATAEMEREDGPMGTRLRVRFQWWRVVLWEKP